MLKLKKFKYSFLAILLFITVFIWLTLFNQSQDNILEITFFDVGQGDSIFIETPNKRQVFTDCSNTG